jgi:hypothetical protein
MTDGHMAEALFTNVTVLDGTGAVPFAGEKHVLGTRKNARLVLDRGFTAGCSAAAANKFRDHMIGCPARRMPQTGYNSPYQHPGADVGFALRQRTHRSQCQRSAR